MVFGALAFASGSDHEAAMGVAGAAAPLAATMPPPPFALLLFPGGGIDAPLLYFAAGSVLFPSMARKDESLSPASISTFASHMASTPTGGCFTTSCSSSLPLPPKSSLDDDAREAHDPPMPPPPSPNAPKMSLVSMNGNFTSLQYSS